MERRPTKRTVNQVSEIHQEDLNMLEPETDVTKMPYQGFASNYDYYLRAQASCFELDSAINEIVSKKFLGNNLRNMTDEAAIEAYKALEQAKLNRSKVYLDIAKLMSDDMFFRKQQEIERMKLWGQNVIIPAEDTTTTTSETDPEKTEEIKVIKREQQQQVLRLLQEAVVQKMEQEPLE